tara:strand:+ start:664 stop:909 length:246 start_codon:yes stop_codon:yes gene_type:complete
MIQTNTSFYYLDLRGTPCPLNFVRCSLAVERLKENESMQVDLDRGEPEETVIPGLINAGHIVKVINQNKKFVTLIINRFDT